MPTRLQPAPRRTKRRRVYGLETLESRLALDAQGATLVDDVFTLRQNGPQEPIAVLANDLFDSDYAGERRITSVSYGSEGGRLEIAPDGESLLYTPPADFAGVETFDYAVDGAHTATVRVTLESPLRDDDFTVLPTGEGVSLDVLGNDPFWAGYTGPGRITSVSVGSQGGVIEIAPDGKSIRYTAPDNAVQAETFVYVVDDLYSARVTVSIPDPLAKDRYDLVQHDPATPLDVLANDPFWAGYTGERRITHVVSSRSETAVEIAPDGKSLIYTPDFTGQTGTWFDTVTYVVDGLYEEQAQVIVYRPVVDDTFEVDQDSTGYEFEVTANDRYRLYGAGSYSYIDVVDVVTAVTQSENSGAVSISADGRGIVYTPAPGFTGVDTFTYVADGVHEATVSVNVTRPVRDDRIGSLYQDTPGQTLGVLANDFLGNGYTGPRVITGVGPTENGGTVQIAADGKTLLYTPAAGYVGADRFEYTVDGVLTATVEVTVVPLADGDNLRDDHYRLGETYTVNVLGNDHFQNGYLGPGQLTGVEILSGEADFTFTANGAITVTPLTNGVTLRYTVDGQYSANLSVSIPQQTTRDQFVVDQNSGEHAFSVLANDFNKYNSSYTGPRRITEVSATSNGGTVTVSADGSKVHYTPPEDFYGADSFSYTVDGFWTETVTVNVIRRVRDDLYRVDSADGAQTLTVLVNDLFGADYAGVGQITGVTAPASGGSATISADGRSIEYTPAPGYSGVDTFVYTVDGALKSTVSVVVDAAAPGESEQFAGVDDYFDFLLAGALQRYAGLFGQTGWGPVYPTVFTTAYDGVGDSERAHSETNVQVAGVDEGDLVEFDEDYSYVLTDAGVTILDAWPAEELSVASQIDVTGKPIAMFLYGDRLTVISQVGGYSAPWYDSRVADTSYVLGGYGYWPWTPSETVITVLDVSDREAPQVVQTTTMDGSYIDSRSIDGQVYAIVSNTQTSTLAPQLIDDDNDPETPSRYETEAEFVARVTANQGQLVEDTLPGYTTTGADGEVVRTGLLNTPDTIHKPLVDGANTLISIVSIDAESDAPGLTDTTAVYSTGAGTVYATRDSLYVLDSDRTAEDGVVTRVAKFDWDPASGGVDFATSTTVPGKIVNQFAVDETDGLLRIATTVNNTASGNWTGRDENLLFVLAEDGGVLEAVGSIQNWALDEDIRSVRFLGDRAFVTTFRTIDPLFALDLSDPTNPEAVGHVTLPGFTSYMHLVDQNHLLTVGTNTPNGHGGPTQVALFDISDLLQPIRLAEYTFSRFTTSEAQTDHHAFGYFDEHGLLAVPVASSFVERTDADGDGYSETKSWIQTNRLAVFTVDVTAADRADRLRLSAEIEHDAAVRRSGYIGDKLYSIGEDAVKVVDIADPGTVIAEAELPVAETPGDGYSLTPIVVDLYTWTPVTFVGESPATDELAEALLAARKHLAGRLGVAEGAPLLVSVEGAPDAPGGGETAVFQIDGVAYLYRIAAGGRFEPATADYAFGLDPEAWNAVRTPSAARPTAAPGDFNRDGVVDESDKEVWRQAYGDWSLTEFLAADANLDGVVDAADYSLWRDNLTPPASVVAPPEPDQTEQVQTEQVQTVPAEAPRERAFEDWRSTYLPAPRAQEATTQRVALSRVSRAAPPRDSDLLLYAAAGVGSQTERQAEESPSPTESQRDVAETVGVADEPAPGRQFRSAMRSSLG